MRKHIFLKGSWHTIKFLCLILFITCKNPSGKEIERKPISKDSIYYSDTLEGPPNLEITSVNVELEAEYSEMLTPISSLKTSHPKIYWFIVSWLKTNYKTPKWTGYYSEEWKAKAKLNGIDCSGFCRVMLDKLFNKKISGGSQGILDRHCNPIGSASLEMGDLVFFSAPFSTNDRIVHIGVYLKDRYFVHATSTKSAAMGLGLSINSLDEIHWANDFVTGGRVED